MLHVEQQVESRVMTLLKASRLVSLLLRVVSRTWSTGVKTLLRVSTLLRVASSIWCMVDEGAPLAGSGIQIPGGAGAGDMLSLDSSSCVSLRVAFRKISCSSLCSRCPHLETWCIISLWPRIWQSRVRCLGVACGVQKIGFFGRSPFGSNAWLDSRYMFCISAWLWTNFTYF